MVTIEKVRPALKQLLTEHAELKNFLSGFGPKKICKCPGCLVAREVLREETPSLKQIKEK